MLRATHIRTKLAVALAVPLVGLVVVAGFEVVSAAQDVGTTRTQTELATASVGPGSLITRLQDERNRASIDLIGLGDAAGLPVATNEEARLLVDTAIPELQAEIGGHGRDVAAAFAPAWEAMSALKELRADIDAYKGPMDLSNDALADDVFSAYTDIVESFFDATSTVALAVDDAALRNGVEIVDAAARSSETRARIVRRVVLAMVGGAVDSPAAGQEVSALYDRGLVFDDAIRTNATGVYAGVADSTFAEPGVQSFNSQVEAFLAGNDVSITEMLAAVKSEPDVGYLGLRSRAADALTKEAHRIEGDALTRQKLFGGIALSMLLLALLVTWLASRSITRPLASLRRQAEDMAGTRLPAALRQILDTPPGEDVVIPEIAPIQVKSRDEVAEVAAALSAVHTSALDLAVEQAVLRRNISDSYINLGRRNQNLLSRQLDFITDLERNETDPDTLEGLFRLDHLATRMRRNAESLLVLAGIEPPRQWSVPVQLADVVRAALGEVEDYQRVVIRHLEPASVTGAVAANVAHVTAELIENALSFSPPDQPVEVKGRLTIGGYTLVISDNGYGMPPADLDRANRRLAGHESFTVAPSRYLGHYVAGHLASRLGVHVELQDSPGGGVAARVEIPMGLLANEETDPRLAHLSVSSSDPAPSAPAARAAVAAPPAPPAHLAPAAPQPVLETEPVLTSEALATPEATPAPEPVVAPVASSFTASGLPRRGVRPLVASDVDLDAILPVAEADASTTTTVSMQLAPAATPDHEPRVEVVVEPLTAEAELAPVVADPVPEPVVPERSEPFAASGFGGLVMARPSGPSLYSVAAHNARSGGTPSPAAPDTMSTGLTRRVPGAQRPDAGFGALRSTEPEREAEPTKGEPSRSTPEDVYSFLSSFQSGVARGRADAHPDTGLTEGDR